MPPCPDARPVAVLTGATGQDAPLLAALLRSGGRRVVGVARPGRESAVMASAFDAVVPVALDDAAAITALVRHWRPDRVFHLAGCNFAATDARAAAASADDYLAVNARPVAHFLEAIRRHAPEARFFHAASCHVFGRPAVSPQDEETPIAPVTLYGASKAAGLHLCRAYREQHGCFAVGGILYNHESPARPASFITARLARAAARAAAGGDGHVEVRDLDALVDWGAAEDYVRAFCLALDAGAPDDFIIATGEGRTVRAFAEAAFAVVGLDWRDWVRADGPRPGPRAQPYIGDSSRLRARTGWAPRIAFASLVSMMVHAHSVAGAGGGAPLTRKDAP
ncbi:MAG: GDP-mannose 4,6-dehydratase [Gemmatimonadales bacterium]|nr:GDP-mannose 4,6-dehydratase [Gemmatimonadales bacterium]